MKLNKLFLTLIMATLSTNLFAMESNNNNLNSGSGKEEEMEIVEFENVLTLSDMPDEILESIIIFAVDEKDLKQVSKNFQKIALTCKDFSQLLNGSGIKTFLVKKAFIENKDLFEIFEKLGIKNAIIFDPKVYLANNTSMKLFLTLEKELKELRMDDSVTLDFLAKLNSDPKLLNMAKEELQKYNDIFVNEKLMAAKAAVMGVAKLVDSNVNANNSTGVTALMHAAQQGHTQILQNAFSSIASRFYSDHSAQNN